MSPQVFYRMCRGAPESMKKALNLTPEMSNYEYTKHGMQECPPGLDDVKDFAVMEKSMTVSVRVCGSVGKWVGG